MMTFKTSNGIRAFAPQPVPRLVLGGPVLVAAIAIALVFAGGFLFNRHYAFDRFAIIPGAVVASDKITVVRAPHDAVVAKIFVRNGEKVQAGRLIARLDNRALDAELTFLRKQVATTRAQLAKLQGEAKAALGRSRLGRFYSPVNTAAMAARSSEIDRSVRSLLMRIHAAEQKVAQASIYAKVTGSIELIRGMGALTAVRYAEAILRIVGSDDKLRVRAVLPRSKDLRYSAGDEANVILAGVDGRRYGPFHARIHSISKYSGSEYTESRTEAGAGVDERATTAEFEFIAPRSQIAKQIEIQSQLRAEIVIKTGEQSLMGLLFGAVL